LALSKPVAASDVSGVRDIVDGYGQIVLPANSPALADALRFVLADLESANRRAAQGKSHIYEYTAAASVAEAHIECYQSVVSNRQDAFGDRGD
jgi:glycosyltransferase involved in cell wall biosynthesis